MQAIQSVNPGFVRVTSVPPAQIHREKGRVDSRHARLKGRGISVDVCRNDTSMPMLAPSNTAAPIKKPTVSVMGIQCLRKLGKSVFPSRDKIREESGMKGAEEPLWRERTQGPIRLKAS